MACPLFYKGLDKRLEGVGAFGCSCSYFFQDTPLWVQDVLKPSWKLYFKIF